MFSTDTPLNALSLISNLIDALKDIHNIQVENKSDETEQDEKEEKDELIKKQKKFNPLKPFVKQIKGIKSDINDEFEFNKQILSKYIILQLIHGDLLILQ